MALDPAGAQLAQLLVQAGAITSEAAADLVGQSSTDGTPVSKLALGAGVAEKHVLGALAVQSGLSFIDLDETPLNPQFERVIPADLARRHQAVAVDGVAGQLLVAMANPGDAAAVADLGAATGWDIKPALAVRSDLARLITAVYGGEAQEAAMPASLSTVMNEHDGVHINTLLQRVVDLEGSDLHLTVGIHPSVRIHGEIKPLTEFPILEPTQLREMVYAILTQKQRERFEDELELDTSHSVPQVGRFRVNVFMQRTSIGAVMRVIPYEIKALDALGLPSTLNSLAMLPRGLVLVTGPTGSGKSTTLASMVDVVNTTKNVHIMTVEDPIEFLHNHKTAVVNQREVGEDTQGFAMALKHVLRQDPDVILVGELRDLETISTALTAAETGHLVFATLHTQDAPQSVDRIIDVFPSHQQEQVRVQLASCLQGVVTQQLVPTKDGKGRVAAIEILVATPAVRNLIREGKVHQISSAMQAGGKFGMQTMDQDLARLVKAKRITLESALERCASEDDLKRLIQGGN